MAWLMIYLKGMAMGAADVVPGVSGGTIAFITGIYERLIQAIRSFDVSWLRLLLSGQWGAAWQRVDGTFLVALLGGIGTSIVLLAGTISWLLVHQPVLIWSFFCGLIVASSLFIVRQIRRWTALVAVLLAVGGGAALAIGVARPAEVEITTLYLFFCGAVAICAMILPGISGSFILVLLGAYAPVLEAVHQAQLGTLAVFLAGCACGLLAFSHLLGWLLQHYHDQVMAALTGFLIGSLYLIWPWKEVLSYRLSSSGEQKPLAWLNVSPARFTEVSGADSQVLLAVLLAVVGIVLVLGLERLSAGGRQDA